MIWYSLLSLLSGLMFLLTALLPAASSTTTAAITNGVSGFRSALISINWFFPIDTALSFIAIMFSIEAILLAWKVGRWIAGIVSVGVVH